MMLQQGELSTNILLQGNGPPYTMLQQAVRPHSVLHHGLLFVLLEICDCYANVFLLGGEVVG